MVLARFKVEIGDQLYEDEVIDFTKKELEFQHYAETRAIVVLQLEKIDPNKLNLHWPVTVDSIDGKRLFKGLVVEANRVDSDKLALICEDSSRYSKETRIINGFHNFPWQEAFFYAAKRMPEIQIQEKNVPGLSLNKSRRRFRVITPILGLDLREKKSILGVDLAPKDSASEDEVIIARIFAKDDGASVWNQSGTRAEITLEATYFDQAALEARRRVVSVVDWLSYILRLSIPVLKNGQGPLLVPWTRERGFASVTVGEEAYVRDLSESSAKAYLHGFLVTKGDPILTVSGNDLDAYSNASRQLFQLVEETSDAARRFWLALHWLRRAREAVDNRDRLLDLWITLEFLTGQESPSKLCSNAQVDVLSHHLSEKAIELGVLDPDLVERRFRNSINKPSLQERFDILVSSATPPIHVDKREGEVVWDRLRKSRNRLEHGKAETSIASEDLDVMDQMLSKMIWALANHMG
jgi:hypothetical protein